jgi:hypothetical protein
MELKQRYIEVETFEFDHSFIDKLSSIFQTVDSIIVTKKIDTLYKKKLLSDSNYTFGGLISRKNKKDRFFSIDIITFENDEIGLIDVNEIELNQYLELITHGQYFENIKLDTKNFNQQEIKA